METLRALIIGSQRRRAASGNMFTPLPSRKFEPHFVEPQQAVSALVHFAPHVVAIERNAATQPSNMERKADLLLWNGTPVVLYDSRLPEATIRQKRPPS